MIPYAIKILISLALILAVTEAAKRFGFWGSLLAALPLISIISMILIYLDTRDPRKIAAFSTQIFWLVLPSLGLFAALPALLQKFPFPLSLALACLLTLLLYLLLLALFRCFHYDPFR